MEDKQHKSSTLFITTLTSFLIPFMGSSISVALPSIGLEFSMDAIMLSWIATAYILAAAMFLVPFGRLADIYGRRGIFISGAFVFTIASLFCGLATSSVMLIVLRVVQGAGAAMIFGTAMAILASVFKEGERGRALGINVAGVYLGLSVGPFAGGFLTHYFGWRSIFFVNVPLGILIILVASLKLRTERSAVHHMRFDLTGSIIYSLSLVVLMLGVSVVSGWESLTLIILGLIGIVFFIKWELSSKSPVLDMRLFKGNTVFVFSNLAALINYSATFAVGFLLSLYLQYIRGLTPEGAGLVLASQPIVMAIASPFTGRLSDKIEPRLVASFGMLLTFLGLLPFIFINGKVTLEWMIADLVLIGFGFALFSSPNTNAIMSSVGREAYGVASATVGTMRLVGQMLSMAVVTLVFATYMGRVTITEQNHFLFISSIRSAFVIFSILCFGGIFASLARGRVR